MSEKIDTLSNTNFNFPNQSSVYHGKVRDVYLVGNLFVSIVTDRISAFDYILPKAIPYKGQVLNQIAAYFLEATREIVPNWYEKSPDPNVSIGSIADPIRIEVVVRGYLTGHAWRTYNLGKRTLCGVPLAEGMKKNQAFEQPIITPTIKAIEGHDSDISEEELLNHQHISPENWEIIKRYAFDLFGLGQKMANERGLILVDTKYEFGFSKGEIILIDEIHTPDSSRYFYKEDYENSIKTGDEPKQLSKEFVREWLLLNGFSGLEGQNIPEMDDQIVTAISDKYIELYELVTGKTFIRENTTNFENRIYNNLLPYLS
ncbi:MAG: phosphoribosylaminoimidazolesuccinocarboxamide synthase [Saprospiraceae bacterium]